MKGSNIAGEGVLPMPFWPIAGKNPEGRGGSSSSCGRSTSAAARSATTTSSCSPAATAPRCRSPPPAPSWSAITTTFVELRLNRDPQPFGQIRNDVCSFLTA